MALPTGENADAMIRCIKIVSGGQAGVDRAALDVARRLSLRHGGWSPKGRRAEDGPIPRRYRLKETPSRNYGQRTKWNVRDADGTLVVNRGPLDGGTLLTVELARDTFGKPVYVQRLEKRLDIGRFRAWLNRHHIRTLNVAGPRESKRPGIYAKALRALGKLFPGSARWKKRMGSCMRAGIR